MLLQPTTSKPPLTFPNNNHANLSSTSSYSLSFPSGFCNSTIVKSITTRKIPVFRYSISQVCSYGTMDHERRPMVRWNAVYKRISKMENPNLGSGSVLNQWENGGKRLTKWDLSRVVKELRKFRRYKPALEVYEWMNNRPERFRITSSDTAIQLDLIAKVHGISSAEEYFTKLPDSLKDKRIYGALLNSYVRARMREKAESLMNKLRNRGYACHSLPFNVMMTLYMNLNEFEKVEIMIAEMIEKSIPLDIYSYNIWLSCCGSHGSSEKMEEVLERMKLETAINPNWTTYSTMATMYIKLGQLEKAEDCLRKIEDGLTGRDRIPFHYLISLYGSLGKRGEVYRVWNVYKSLFPNIPNLGYHAMISSLVRLSDIGGAENTYDEWVSVKSMYDPRIGNLLLGWYVREGFPDKAHAFYDQMIGGGGKPNAATWEILAEDHIRERRLSEALSCLKEATSALGSKSWRPRPINASKLLRLCEEEGDMENKDALLGVLRQVGCLEDNSYMSSISELDGSLTGGEPAFENDKAHDDDDNGAEILMDQLQ